jgi:hypothetical protein
MMGCLYIKSHKTFYVSCLQKNLDMALIMERTFLTRFTYSEYRIFKMHTVGEKNKPALILFFSQKPSSIEKK